jgi:hypothetical protein
MRKIYILVSYLSICYNAYSQVGINTTTPKAQLEIKSSNQATPLNTDGILIPKMDAFPTTNPTAAQDGMMVYLTQTVGVNQAGFYFWKNSSSIWIGINGILSETDPQVSSATTNTIPKYNGTTLVDGIIIDNGTNVGIGTTPTAGNKLEVAGKTLTSILEVTNKTTTDRFRMINGAVDKYILQSDFNGNASWEKNNGGFTHYLGELYLGGIIFELYKGSDGLEHGLVIYEIEEFKQWQSTISLISANRLEDGSYNTFQMINSPAKDYANSLTAGGGVWYIPSIDELDLIEQRRYIINKALRLANKPLLNTLGYYSSTQYDQYNAYHKPYSGQNSPLYKSNYLYVRCIKSF